jgi:hypothetical protein
MLDRFLKWLNPRPALSLNDEERQNLTTYSMMGGVIALTFGVGLLLYVLRYSWPAEVVLNHAALLIGGLFNVSYGLLGLMAIMVIAQAVIAIGGKMKASFGGASIEAEAEGSTRVTALSETRLEVQETSSGSSTHI